MALSSWGLAVPDLGLSQTVGPWLQWAVWQTYPHRVTGSVVPVESQAAVILPAGCLVHVRLIDASDERQRRGRVLTQTRICVGEPLWFPFGFGFDFGAWHRAAPSHFALEADVWSAEGRLLLTSPWPLTLVEAEGATLVPLAPLYAARFCDVRVLGPATGEGEAEAEAMAMASASATQRAARLRLDEEVEHLVETNLFVDDVHVASQCTLRPSFPLLVRLPVGPALDDWPPNSSASQRTFRVDAIWQRDAQRILAHGSSVPTIVASRGGPGLVCEATIRLA